MDHRGFASVEEMNETMIEKWNARVRKKDEVVIIGDLSFGSVQETNELVRAGYTSCLYNLPPAHWYNG